MKQIGIIILTLFVIYSCGNKQTKKNKQTEIVIQNELTNETSLTRKITEPKKEKIIENIGLSESYRKAVKCFPNDSASLNRLYFKWNSTTNQEKIDKQIKRLEKLTSKQSVERYRNIENNLKPLMTRVVNSATINQSQSDSLVTLYSDYDYFSGEALFTQLLTNDENYTLVWESFKIMVKESRKDTCYISGLIKLNRNVRTNVELAEALEDFKVEAITNNPLGFLDMYNSRHGEQRNSFAYNITVWEDPTKEIMDLFIEISQNSTDENYKKLATELIDKFKVD
ncbi:hypothetical protein [Carboxylicivirga sp. RSCT41]|uniref:hypothetical protein n=1 Tax=Carboxylicivirga agarovorans TaxID=3417570 RepID=UPI003D339606